jgi:TolB-like protein/Tfp pilus assembly protein PilF
MSPQEADPLLGSELGRYRIVAKLGEGGMGVVYRARDSELGRDVALKVLPPAVVEDAKAREALLREARLASGLNHPNICTIHEVGQALGRLYIAMELVDGRPLRGLIPTDGFADETVVRYAAPLARALAHAHARHVIHRDLKPANVVITADGQPKLLDFGLSRRRVEEARSLSPSRPGEPSAGLAGTPATLAPELLMGAPAGIPSDLWAFGVVLYEMCSGRPPFAAEHVGGLVTAILHAVPAPLPAHTSAGLRAVVTRCLAKEPAQRYASADELAAALEALLPGVAGAVATPPRRAGRARRLAITLAIGVPLALAAAFAYFRWGPGHETLEAPTRTVLILPLEVRGQVQGTDFAGRAFAEALAMDLAQGGGVRVVPVPADAELPGPRLRERTSAALAAGAGRLLVGALTREGDSLRVSLSLIDAQAGQVVWGEARSGRADDLARLASTLAPHVAERLGAPPAVRYDDFMYVTGPPEMSTSPEMTAALGAVRRYETRTALEETARLVARFPRQPDARVLRLAALVIDAQLTGPDERKGRTIAAEMETLRSLDPRSPWIDVVRAMLAPAGSPEGVRLLSGVLARNDLTPAARSVVLATRADLFGNSLRDTSAALADAEEAIRLDPASDLSLSTLARWLSNRGRHAEAAERVRQALALNPTVVNYWHQLGNCMLKQGRWEEYVADLEHAARISPNADAVLSAQCEGLSCVGRYREAAECARRAMRLQPGSWYYGLELATCLMRLGAWPEAVPLLDRACREGYPIHCPMHAAARAVTLIGAGDRAAARAQARQADAGPESKSSNYALACYDARAGDREAALARLERFPARGWVEPALATDPNFASLRGDARFERVVSWMKAQSIASVFAGWGRSR